MKRNKSTLVYIIGGGPSIVGQDLCHNLVERLMDKNVLGVNNALYLPCTKVLFFGDAKWYWWNREAVQAFPGPKHTLNLVWRSKRDTSEEAVQTAIRAGHKTVQGEPNLTIWKRAQILGSSARPNGLASNRSSGAAAIDLAAHLGAKSIVLLGYDMRNVNGVKNFLSHEKEHTNQNPYEFFLKGIEYVAKAVQQRGVKLFNATPNSAIPDAWIKSVSIEKCL